MIKKQSQFWKRWMTRRVAVQSSEIVSRLDADGYYEPGDKDEISDGFGSTWSAWCCMCGKKTMHIVRPGKVQCDNCG